MNILYIHQFFAGPDAPGPAQPRALVRSLADRGHTVTVLACDLNAYNEQREPEETLPGKAGGGVTVIRLPVPGNLRGGLKNRLRTYITFAWRAVRSGRRLPRPDVVFVSIQPLFSGVAAKRLARHWRIPWMLELRDLWPDALVVKKAIAPWQGNLLEKLARSLYFSADRVVSLTPGIKTELLKKGVPTERLDLLPNGFQPTVFDLLETTRRETRRELGWRDDQTVAVYAGTHVEVTAIEVIVRAAKELRDRPDIRLDLFGSGQSKPAAVALAKELKLENIHFHDPVPKSRIPAILAGADIGVMTLFKSPLVHIYFENKLIDYMGAGLPIAASMDGVQAELIRREEAGRVVPGLDPEGLAVAIRSLADDPEARREMGTRGHGYISATLSQDPILDRYAETLEALAADRGDALPVFDPLNLS